METRRHDEQAVTTAHLPQPRGRARWRWSTPGRTALAGGRTAAVLGLGTGERRGATRPTVAGRITAPSGNAITLRWRGDTVTTGDYTVDSTAGTTFTVLSARGTTSGTSAPILDVGAFIGVRGITKSDGTVSASRIVVRTRPPGGRVRPRAAGGRRA
jgi:hypothetical protein